jgi:excinuclease UvrABC ATPase subunit
MAEQIQALPDGTRLLILGPLVKDRKGEHQGVLEEARRAGFSRVRVNGEIHDAEETLNLARYKRHSIEAVVDRIGSELHELSGRAKDLGSAAVFCSIVLAAMIWLTLWLD